LGIQYISGLYKDVNNGLKEEYLLLNLRLTYRAGHMFSLFIRGENLLDRTYEIIAGYTMPGTTLDGGFSLTF
jgi:outer membrane cobalamin receptor